MSPSFPSKHLFSCVKSVHHSPSQNLSKTPHLKHIFYVDSREPADAKVLESLKEKGIKVNRPWTPSLIPSGPLLLPTVGLGAERHREGQPTETGRHGRHHVHIRNHWNTERSHDHSCQRGRGHLGCSPRRRQLWHRRGRYVLLLLTSGSHLGVGRGALHLVLRWGARLRFCQVTKLSRCRLT